MAKDLETLRSFCISNGTWSPTARHSNTPFHYSTSSLHLPLHSSTLFFISRIHEASGTFQVLSSTIPERGPQVYVTARHIGENALDNVSVCLMEKLPGVVGAAIFGNGNEHLEPIDFTITLLLPASSPANSIYDVETDLPKYSHHLDLQQPLGSVNLASKGMPIIANVEARDIEIETSHAPIEGKLKASEFLCLKTSHFPISVNATLENDSSSFTLVSFENTHSSINANLELVSSTSEGGKYDIEVSAPNTELKLVFSSSPLNSVLRIESVTSELPSHITLPPQYGGSFELVSQGGIEPTIVDQSGYDPSVILSSKEDGGKVMRGVVRPGASTSSAAGSVNVTTSKASSTLVFQ